MFDAIIIVIIFVAYQFIVYGVFSSCLSDDVEFAYGRKHMRNLRKKNKNFWEKVFFLDIKGKVKKWHYVCFWINLVSFFPMLFCFAVYALNDSTFKTPWGWYVSGFFSAIHLFTASVASFAHWPLYRGNKIRNRKKYRRWYNNK